MCELGIGVDGGPKGAFWGIKLDTEFGVNVTEPPPKSYLQEQSSSSVYPMLLAWVCQDIVRLESGS